MPAVTLEQKHCDFTVRVDIEFDNQTGRASDANFRRMIDRRMDQAKALWNGPAGRRTFGCCTVRFVFDWKIAGSTLDVERVHVIVLPGAGKGKERAWMSPSTQIGESYDTDTGVVYAHELGHVLGLDDEYDKQTGQNLNPQTGPIQSIMGTVDGVVGVLQEHIDKVMAHLRADCPEDCCPPKMKDRHAEVPKREPRPARDKAKAPPADSKTGLGALGRMLRASDARAGEARDELVRRGAKAVPVLVRVMHDGPPLGSRLATGALAEIGGDTAMRALSAALTDPRIGTRLQAAYELALRGEPAGLPVLIGAVTTTEPLVGIPPGAAWRFALDALESATGVSLGHPAHAELEVLARLQREWSSWLRLRPAEDAD